MIDDVWAKADVVYSDGKPHRYWSTHCRHDDHDACKATELAPGVPRRPAQCKTCAAPCRCECHAMSETDVRELATACTCDGGSLHEVWCAKVRARLN